ncbi:MAG: hypothetical protein KJ607_03655, partial [Bacteroidetes bacterium]|nr:hypothetical protein [Bacteroidota bacterium]
MNKLMYFIIVLLLSGSRQGIAWNAPVLSYPDNGADTWTGLRLNWDAVATSEFYQMELDTSPAFNSPVYFTVTKAYINSSSSNSDTYHDLENLFFGQTYYWRVRAWVTGDTSSWTTRNFITRNYVNLSSPSYGSNVYAGLTIDWDAHTGVDYYEYQVDTSANFDSPVIIQGENTYVNSSSSNSDTEKYIENLFFGKTYHWRVRARNAVDTCAWSSAWTFDTRDYVGLASPSDGSDAYSGLTVDWYAHTGVD